MRRVRRKSVYPLWELDRWDGPLAGVCLYPAPGAGVEGRPYYFECYDSMDAGQCEPRVYRLHPLTDDEYAEQRACHEDFRLWVSAGCDYEPGTWRRMPTNLRPYSEHHLFYDKYKDGPKLRWRMENELAPLFFLEFEDGQAMKAEQRRERLWFKREGKKKKSPVGQALVPGEEGMEK